MLFWIFVLFVLVGIAGIIAYHNTMVNDWCLHLSAGITTIGALCLAISLVCISSAYIGTDGYIAENQAIYDSLIHQYENDIYDNDNDLGKKELMSEIQEWNGDLARYREIQDDFWIGIFYPNIYYQFEFIEYK